MNPHHGETEIEDVLATGPLRVEGQFLWGSNYTFLARVQAPDRELAAVYKPMRGEQPLWDFPEGTLAQREVAAYLTSQALGWDLVPPTVLRADGPAGPGSVQLYVDADAERHYFTFSDAEKERLRPAALFDILVNNADRKGGHVLLDSQDHLWLIDHGVCFHAESKLRTVIWDFAGQPVPDGLTDALKHFRGHLAAGEELARRLETLLSAEEIQAMRARAEGLLEQRRFPHPGPGRPYPWPLV
ncbi:MAG: hypothetical protein A2Y93_11290 [Chloroflexi bacterium RBG_13_68_17]|nr:MAG: hypothetical protein A2Y93_11290 [Chloroflexi bacterium RBG_13_68_17]